MTTLTCKVQYLNDTDPFGACTQFPEPSRPPLYTFNVNIPLINQIATIHRLLKAPHRTSCLDHKSTNRSKYLDDCALQLYKYGTENNDFANYLDLEATIDEQSDEFDSFTLK
ncbi:unnamed protein product [Oppiella nova]|uniref:FHOD1 N-terminal GTPase-binding domain-containing protein n=1 Tax=Oppiella nova TaxID=334625 RepID=A0A7R9QDV0_9ACAR|nr:unnamed protein product [Oppiella nova]CAG2163904.1 unnamed protein product [Oppiella nova]